MIRSATSFAVPIACAAALAFACLVGPAGATPAGATAAARWSNSHCQLQQAFFNVRHPHPTGLQVAGGNRTLRSHGCAQRVPGPKHWSSTQCVDYQGTFLKLHGYPTGPQLAAANTALKNHGCTQRVLRPPTQQ